MTDQVFTRRSSYGPTSPTIGTRGARTRQQIIESASEAFVEQGFHATSVEDIAARANTSRATLYQYFESKDAIFTELMIETGDNMIRMTRQIGALGPTADGYEHLAVWVREWVANYDRHAPMFIEWQNVIAPASPLRPEVVRFNEAFWRKLAKEITKAGHPDKPADVSAQLVTSTLQRFNYIRHVFRPGLSQEQFTAGLTVALQRYLFPTTPLDVLVADPLADDGVKPLPVHVMGPLAAMPTERGDARDPLDGLSPQARATARELIDAARRVFNRHGYGAAHIDQVLAEAGLARGTFYRYFDNLVELMVPLSVEASTRLTSLFRELPAESGDPRQLREWLARALEVQRHYSGTMRAWFEGYPLEPALLSTTADVVVAVSEAIQQIFGPSRPYPLARRAAGMLLSGLIENFPNEAVGASREPSARQIIEAEAAFIERVILPDN
jgi:AcrR family transcriptional regulator